jgi:archaellum component FlaC
MENPDEKLATLSVLVDGLKRELPQIQEHISEMYRSLTFQEANYKNLNAQYEKLAQAYNSLIELQYISKKLTEDTNRNIKDIEHLREQYQELIQNPPCSNKQDKQNGMTMEKAIKYAPNIIGIITFVSYIVYSVLVTKINNGGL